MEHDDYSQFGGWFRGHGHRMNRGDISPIILDVLKEKPMHGYEIMRKLEEKSYGLWRPSPGSVYPTLQLLEEQDLVRSKEEDGKKVYELTEAGRTKSSEGYDHEMPPHWKQHMHKGKRFIAFKETFKNCAMQMRTIGMDGTDEHIARAKVILDNAVQELTALADEVRQHPHD